MSFLISNAAAIAVAAVISALGWMFGGTRGEVLTPVMPWLLALMAEIALCFPQRHGDETTYDARERVWRAIKRDPFTWVVAAFLALLLVPFVNNGLCVTCDAELIAQGVDPAPAVPFLPFCVDRLDHWNVVLWFYTALPAAVVVRHCLTARGKRLMLALVVWNGAMLSLLGFVQHALDAPGPLWSNASGLPPQYAAWRGDFFSTFGYPNMAGDYFALLFGISVALWRDSRLRLRLSRAEKDISGAAAKRPHTFWEGNHFLIPAVICFYGSLNSLSRAAVILATASAVIYMLHAFVSYLARLRNKVARVRTLALGLLGMALLMFAASLFIPDGASKEIKKLETSEMLDRVSGRGQYLTRVATELWKDNKLFGCGGWGFAHFTRQKLLPGESMQTIGGINVHNDYLQLLAEHGIVGFGLLVAAVVMLVWPICKLWRRLVRDTRFMKSRDLPARPVQIFILPAPLFVIFVASLCTLIHAFGDCPLRSPAILALFFATLAAMPGFLPEKGRQCSTQTKTT